MERYVRLINEVERLCSLDATEIDSLYRQCLPMVEHNFTVLESKENIPPFLKIFLINSNGREKAKMASRLHQY